MATVTSKSCYLVEFIRRALVMSYLRWKVMKTRFDSLWKLGWL